MNRAGSSKRRGAICAALFALGICLAARGGERPNVLVLFTDDHRADAIGAWGNPHISTPNLDRLVGRGYSFRRNYCMGSPHGAVCVPSRAMLLSGRAYTRIPLDLAGVTTLPEHLRARGYATFITGKWHNEAPSLARSFAAGRAIMMGGMSDHERVPLLDLDDTGRLVNARYGEGFSSEIFADTAIEFLRNAPTESPFFCYVAFTAPHDPRMPPAAYREKYYAKRPPLPASFLPQHPFDNGDLTTRDENLAPWPRTEDVIRDQLAEYYGLIEHLDAQIGRVLDALEASAFSRNTIVVLAADQGIALGNHGLLGKQSLYEHSMRALLNFSGPGIPAGETRALTSLFDIAPTLCELLGVDAPASLDGISLAPLWRGEKAAVRERVFLAYGRSQRAIVEPRWKLIRYPLVDLTQLFDLEADPAETRDLSREPEQAERMRALLEALAQEQARFGDAQPLSVTPAQRRVVDLRGLRGDPDPWQPEWIVKKYFNR